MEHSKRTTDHNISQYFPNEITKIYDEKYDLMYHVEIEIDFI